jgi:hypothetical protein
MIRSPIAMNLVHARRATMLAALALLAGMASGCNKKITLPTVVQQRPTLRLSAAPIDTIGTDGRKVSYIYHYKMNWVGYDPDGRVDHFMYVIDPPGWPGGGVDGDSTECGKSSKDNWAWCSTKLNEKEIFFKAAVPPDTINRIDPHALEIHTFIIKAVDNAGLESEPVYRSFFSDTQAPTIQIDSPRPGATDYGLITPFVNIRWHGNDPDGVFTQRPIKYKFKMFKDTDDIFDDPPNSGTEHFDKARREPETLRKFFAPVFAGWDSSSADTTFATYSNLVPQSRYLFVVVGFDEAGAYSPVWSRDINMLQLLVTFAGNNGPVLTISNEFFNYSYSSGGYNLDPSRYINLEVPAQQPLHFNWSAEAPNGSQMKQYRWSMDMTNLDDQTPRTDERTDLKRWSQWGLNNVSATVGPFYSDTTHIFFIEAEDINGLKSLGIVSFRVVVPTFNRDLLIVNDTRLTVDQKVLSPPASSPDSLGVPAGAWPSRAELDTFLFARGGVRWRMTPTGTLSQPGIFAGYKYDTAYTAAGGTNGFVTLDTLGRYKHVLWITDINSATAPKGAGVLRGMSEKGRANTLAAYVALGGQVWIAGGTSIRATMLPWNLAKNDLESPFNVTKFSITPTVTGRAAELGPGRMVFDQANWRSDVWLSTASSDIVNVHKSVRAVGNYPSRMDKRWGLVRSPDYSLLTQRLGKKTAADDPVPPNRAKSSFFNAVLVYNLEFMTPGNPGLLKNAILEDADPDPDVTNNVSMLDTLLIASLNFNGIPVENEDLSQGGKFYRSFPVMTYYHGQDSPPFVLSGHDLWTFTRKDLIKLVDFVFQQIWGMPKEPIVAPAAPAPAPAAPSRAPAAPARTAARARR